MKICKKCNNELPETDEFFRKHKRGKNGLYHICKNCMKHSESLWVDRAIKKMHSSKNSGKGYNFKKVLSLDRQYLNSLKEKQEGKCYWLGIDIDFSGRDKLRDVSIDRLDNEIGYIKGNIVLSTRFANLGRCSESSLNMQKFVKNYL